MSKSKEYCSVPGCKTTKRKHPDLSFHCIPRKNERSVYIVNFFGERERVDRRAVWLKNLKISKNVTENTKVCSRHFCREDYFLPDFPAKKRCLKKIAIPTQNLPGVITPKKARQRAITAARLSRIAKRNSVKEEQRERCMNQEKNITPRKIGRKSNYGDNEPNEFHQGYSPVYLKNGSHAVQRLGNVIDLCEEGSVCRLCGNADTDLIPIFQEEGAKVELEIKISKYLQFPIKRDDGLPEKVCSSCFTAVTAWHEFVQSCTLTQKKLQEQLLEKREEYTPATQPYPLKRKPAESKKTTDLINKKSESSSKKIKKQNITSNTVNKPTNKSQVAASVSSSRNKIEGNVSNKNKDSESEELFSYLQLRDKEFENAWKKLQTNRFHVKCGVCYEEFPDYISVASHVMSVHKLGPKQCSSCLLFFDSVETLVNHVRMCNVKSTNLKSIDSIDTQQNSSPKKKKSNVKVICVRVHPDKEVFTKKQQKDCVPRNTQT